MLSKWFIFITPFNPNSEKNATTTKITLITFSGLSYP